MTGSKRIAGLWLAAVIALILAGCASAGAGPQAIVGRFTEPCKPQLDYSDLAWSPDGASILFTVVSGAGVGIATIHTDSGRMAVLTPPIGVNMSGSWSPDGKRIVFVSGRDNTNPFSCPANCPYGLYMMAADGSGQTPLTHQPDQFNQPQWSPDRTQILFELKRSNVPVGIGVVNANGSDLHQLTSGGEESPVWSPDGRRIAFWEPKTDQSAIGVYLTILGVINQDGTGRRDLGTLQADDTQPPAWSPDGKSIVFWGMPGDQADIFSLRVTDGSATRLTNDPAHDSIPDWSPDGSKIAFQSDRSQHLFQVFVMNADGSKQTQLTHNTSPNYAPVWSPDGKRIGFLSQRDGAPEIYVMNADGSNQTRLTTNPANQTCLKWPF